MFSSAGIFQVRFLALSIVVTVQTQGFPNYGNYAKSYRLMYSMDCSSFTNVLDGFGNIKVAMPWPSVYYISIIFYL